jgi:hypothetical protein
MAAALVRVGEKSRGFVLACLASAALAAVLINRTRDAWAGHHVVFVTLGPVLATLAALSALARTRPNEAFAMSGALALCHLAILAAVLSRAPMPNSNWERLEAFRVVDSPEFARSHLVSHLDWGTFSIDALYGPRDQIVTYNEPLLTGRELEKLIGIARANDRRLAFVRRSVTVSDWGLIAARLPELRQVWPDGAKGDGAVGRLPEAPSRSSWQVWAEP